MQREHGKDGVVCLSVSVDEKEREADARSFLVDQNATFANYRLEGPEREWQKRWGFRSPRAMFVFDRLGRRVAQLDENPGKATFTPEDVEKVIKEVLRAKP